MAGSEVGVDESPTAVEPEQQAQPTRPFSRQQLLRPWLIALALLPFLLALISYGAYERPMAVNGPAGDLPTITKPSGSITMAPSLQLSLLTISRSGNSITLIGDCPDDASKAALMRALKALLTPGVNVVDQIRIDPLTHALDFGGAEPVFTAGAPIPDLTFKVERDTVTLTGTAASPAQKEAVARAAAGTWPDVNVANRIVTRGQITPTAPGAATPAPAPPPAASCNDVQAAINAITGGPLAFGNDGVSLTPEDNDILIRVADKLKACPDAKVTVNGYTDNAGSEAINIPLSTQRATAVAEYIIANGVARARVTVKGLGSANPIAGNDTPEGRAKNRRAEIVVG